MPSVRQGSKGFYTRLLEEIRPITASKADVKRPVCVKFVAKP
jgi:hypothetical protein